MLSGEYAYFVIPVLVVRVWVQFAFFGIPSLLTYSFYFVGYPLDSRTGSLELTPVIL